LAGTSFVESPSLTDTEFWFPTTSTRPEGSSAKREARDRQQIDEVMWRYARALDTGDADGYAALYTTDGQFSSGANATKGRDALKKMIAGARQPQPGAQPVAPRPPMYHTTATRDDGLTTTPRPNVIRR